MPPKRKERASGEEEPKKKAPVFNDMENRRLISLYCENRDKYHGKFKSGGRSGESDKQRLLKEWAADISAMGFAIRTKEQIEEKLRNEVKKVQKHLRAEKEKYSGTGGGPGPRVAKLPPYLDPLVDLLGEKHLEHGVPGIEDEPPSEQNLDLSGDTSDNERIAFDVERKPTRKELQPEKSIEDACSKDAASPEVLVVSEKRTAREKGKTAASSARETLSLFKDKRSILWEEETKLARMRQEQAQMEMEMIAARLEEAKLGVELKKVQLEQARLELERMRGAPAAPTPAPTPPVSYPYPTYFNM